MATALSLPPEIWAMICALVPNRDRKSLRSTNSYLGGVVTLRMGRIFLSPNPLDIKVFLEVAEHPVYRLGITEIIYDDARLAPSAKSVGMGYRRYSHGKPTMAPADEQDRCWFATMRKRNLEDLASRQKHDIGEEEQAALARFLDANMTTRESLEYYRNLLQQQRRSIATDDDANALAYGLHRFPNLKRVTITPLTHGTLLHPLYETPMIRSFPRGFNYPMPRGWPCRVQYRNGLIRHPSISPWIGPPGLQHYDKLVREEWRGYRLVTRILAEQSQHHSVSELIVNGHHWMTGLNSNMFEHSNEDYEHFVAIVSKPGFSTLNLTLVLNEGEEWHDWPGFRSGLLWDALRQAPNLMSMALSGSGKVGLMDDNTWNYLTLDTILPVHHWPSLQHLELHDFIVRQSDLMALLASLPLTLTTLQLGFLRFQPGCYHELLCEMRDTLAWKDRDHSPPRVTLVLPNPYEPFHRAGLSHRLDREVDQFLYQGGYNPFEEGSDVVLEGMGILRDDFRPGYERPFTSSVLYHRYPDDPPMRVLRSQIRKQARQEERKENWAEEPREPTSWFRGMLPRIFR